MERDKGEKEIHHFLGMKNEAWGERLGRERGGEE